MRRCFATRTNRLAASSASSGSRASLSRAAPTEQVTTYFEVEDVDAVCDRLGEAGVVFDQAPADMPWLWREARLVDPSGNVICLYHAGVNRLDPPWRVLS